MAQVSTLTGLKRRYRTNWGVVDPDPFTNKLLDALEANMPRRRTKTYNTLYKAIERVIFEEMEARSIAALKARQ
jgi:hypothetical protein